MVKCKRYALSFIFSLLSIFCIKFLFLSENTSAIPLTLNAKPTGVEFVVDQEMWEFAIDGVNTFYRFGNATANITYSYPNTSLNKRLSIFRSTVQHEYKKDHYYATKLMLFSNTNQIGKPNIYLYPTSADFNVVDWTFEQCIESPDINNIFQSTGVINQNLYTHNYTCAFNVILQAKETKNTVFQFGALPGHFMNFPIYDANTSYFIRANNITEYERSDVQKTLDDFKQEDQNQSSEGQNNADQAGTQTEGATQNLLQTLGGFISAFTSASATNCNFDMGEFLGVQDFCSISIPSVYSAILNIVSILVVIPMVYWLFGSITNAFKEFQQ